MTMPFKLKNLQRHLATAGGSSATVSEEGGISNRVLSAIQTAVEAEANEAINAARELQQKAEAEAATLRDKMAELQKELGKAKQDAGNKVEQMHVASQQERDKTNKAHALEIQKLQSQLVAAKQDLANEQQARVRVESELKAMEKMCANMERVTQALKPVQQPATQAIMPQAAPMKPLTMTVSQRDQNGRIVSIAVVPST